MEDETVRSLGLTEDDLDALHKQMRTEMPRVPRERMASVLTQLLEMKQITLSVSAKHIIVEFTRSDGKPSTVFFVDRSPRLS